MQYRVLKAHRGRYGLLHPGLIVTLPRGYADSLMRHRDPLVAPYDGNVAAVPAPGAAAAVTEVQAPGESQAGGTLAVPPAAGSEKLSLSRPRARRSPARTLKTVAAEPE